MGMRSQDTRVTRKYAPSFIMPMPIRLSWHDMLRRRASSFQVRDVAIVPFYAFYRPFSAVITLGWQNRNALFRRSPPHSAEHANVITEQNRW